MPSTATKIRGLSQQDVAFARSSPTTRGRLKPTLQLQINGKPIPAESYLGKIVRICLDHMAVGHAVAVMPVEEEIGTQEAADLLKVSRPYFVKLLDSGAMPSRKVGVQRRVKMEDVLAFKSREKEARKKTLGKLVAESQRLDLGE